MALMLLLQHQGFSFPGGAHRVMPFVLCSHVASLLWWIIVRP